MATANLQVNANPGNANQVLGQLNNSLGGLSEKAKEWTESIKEGFEKVTENYLNIKEMVGDIVGYYNEAYSRQARWNSLMSSDSAKKYADQLNQIVDASKGLTDAYSEVQSIQKLFASGVDLSGEKLTKLTNVATIYAQKMGIDVSEAMQRFVESVAEGNTSKMEDLAVYMDSEAAVLNYAISIGQSAKDVDDLTKKQVILNEILKLVPEGVTASDNAIQQMSATTKIFKQNIDEMVVALGDTVGEGLMYYANEHITTWKIVGESLYDFIHILDDVPETIQGDVLPSAQMLSNTMLNVTKTINETTLSLKNLGIQGIITFQGISANNIDAINKTSEKHKKAFEIWAEEKHAQIVFEDEMSKLEDDLQVARDKKEERDFEKKINRINTLYEFEVEAAQKANEEKIKQMDREKYINDLTNQMTADTFNTKWDMFVEFDKKYNTNFEISAKQVEQMSKEQVEQLIANEEMYQEEKSKLIHEGGQMFADFSAMILNDVLMGEKEWSKEMIGDFAKMMGSKLINTGSFNAFEGAIKAFVENDPRGFIQMKIGGAEVLAGIAMGGVGKMVGTSGGGGSAKDEKTASMDKNRMGDKQKSVIGITTYLFPNSQAYYRQQIDTNRKISKR